MQLEDYFDFDPSGEIRIRGHRIWLEHLLHEYIFREMTPKELLERFPTLDLEKIHACLLYYHAHKEAMDKYLENWLEWGRQCREAQKREHPEWYERMRQIREHAQKSTKAAS